MRFFTIEYDIK